MRLSVHKIKDSSCLRPPGSNLLPERIKKTNCILQKNILAAGEVVQWG